MLQRPLAFVTVAFLAGLVLSDRLQLPLGWTLTGFIVATLGAWCWRRARLYLVLAAAVLAGAATLTWRTAVLSPDDLRSLQGERAELVAVRATLLEPAVVRSMKSFRSKPGPEPHRSVVRARVSSLAGKDGVWKSATGDVLVTSPGDLPEGCGPGRHVQITGVLAPPPGPTAEGLFNYREWLRRNYVYYQLKAGGPEDWSLLDLMPHPDTSWSERFLSWARRTLALGLPEVDEPLQLLWGMTLGEKGVVPPETYEPFLTSGTMHIFAISGLHVVLICGILLSVLRLLRWTRQTCGWAVLPLLWFYTIATGAQASAVRSTIMMSVIVLGWALARPSDLVNSLCAAALIILAWDPGQIFMAGFQLSFFVVLALALLMPGFTQKVDGWLAIDPLLPPMLEHRWKTFARQGARWLLLCLATSFASWIGSLPLTALYFNLFSPVTLLANLAVVPMSSAALASNIGALASGPWCPWLAAIFNNGAWFWMRSMMTFSQWCSGLPAAYCYVPAPSLLDCTILYSLLLVALAGGFTRPTFRPWTIAASLVALLVMFGEWYHDRQSARLTVLATDVGTSIYYRPQGLGSDWLLDTGTSNAVQFVTKPFLRAQGVNTLPTLVLSHGDQNHIGGAGWVADLFAARHISVSPLRFRSPGYRRLIQEFSAKPERLAYVSRHDRLGPWRVLHPQAEDRFARADDATLVLEASLGGTKVLLLGDLGTEGQTALLERTPDLHASLVVAGIPAQGEPLGEDLLDAIRPDAIVISEGLQSAFERASQSLIVRLARRKVPVFYTSADGAVTLRLEQGTWVLQSMGGRSARGVGAF